jgi:hypothetical protein
MDEGTRSVAVAAEGIGAKLESIQTSPDFRRFVLTLESEAVVVDLIRERVPQVCSK